MAHHMTRAAAALALLLALPLPAQVATRFDTAIVRTATLGALLRSARAGDSIARMATTQPVVHALVDRMVGQLARPSVERLPLQLLAGREATVGVVARRRRPEGITAHDAAALDTLAMVMGQEYATLLRPILGADATNQLLDTLEAFNVARRRTSLAESLEKLRRFERKYGPDAPRLNFAEVGLNYVAQWIPGFRPNPEGWPSRLELVASYVPTYLTVVDGKARAVTVAELGPRVYLWRPGWGGREGGVFKPGFVSFGAVLAGERDGALTSPFHGASRFGAFAAWGGAKVAVLGGREKRVLFTRQVQVVPWLF